jgi:hypothetical protein
MNLWRITFTGLDETCQLTDILELWRREPRLEFGFLFSDTRAGEGRYPSHGWIEWMVEELARFVPALALHVCGGARRRFMADGTLTGFKGLQHFDRVQHNGTFKEDECVALQRVLVQMDGRGPALITQHDATPSLAARVRSDLHQVLFDASGGNGITREVWPAPIVGKACGYAGGLGPATLARELPRIGQVAGETPFWIDMENSLRVANDLFSLEAAHRTLDVIAKISPHRTSTPRLR